MSSFPSHNPHAQIIDHPQKVLEQVFGYSEFRDSQPDIIASVMEGKDVLALMTTGGGKSLCFQVPALCLRGTTIVISPLISLMKDQVDTLQRKGVAAGMINSDMLMEEVSNTMYKLQSGQYKLMYVSPERLASKEFMDILESIEIPFFAIDESHCVSMWGHDFRLDYTMLDERLGDLCERKGHRIPRAAYTATATPMIKEDILKQLGMTDTVEYIGSFDRKNLQLNVIRSENKGKDLEGILQAHKGQPTIIYCSTAKAVEELYSQLARDGVKVGMYHGKLGTEIKNKMQDGFLSDQLDVMVATNAFGMGVDKSNIRVIVHYQMPANLEGYGQEVGRGGRDGKPSTGYLLYGKGDRRLHEFFHRMNFPTRGEVEAVRSVLAALGDPGEALPFDVKEIHSMSNEPSLQSFQIDSIMRILDSQNVIELHEDMQGNIGFMPAEIGKHIDLTQNEARHQIARQNLLNMEQFCVTNLCRKRNFLRYFGEANKEHNCGACDVCLGLTQKKEAVGSVIRPEVVKGVMSLVNDMGRTCISVLLRDILAGVRSRTTEKFADHASFGLLSSATIPQIESIIKAIDKDGIIIIQRDRFQSIALSARGKSMHANSENLVIASRGNLTEPKKQSTGFDMKVHTALLSFREKWSKEERMPSVMLLGDGMLEKLATAKPNSLDGLRALGLSDDKIEKFGRQLVTAIEINKTKQELEFTF
jgi:RecQ family ATP-dependent DNA helicase